MILSHIVACAKNNCIGKDNKLPWDIPEDMEFFKNKTRGHIMIMGRKTFESLPGVLTNRCLIVITRDGDLFNRSQEKILARYKEKNTPVFICSTIDESIKKANENTSKWGDEVFIIGGGEIYKQTLDKADIIYLTRINEDFAGDAFYPVLNQKKFKLIDQKDRQFFSFLTYKKI